MFSHDEEKHQPQQYHQSGTVRNGNAGVIESDNTRGSEMRYWKVSQRLKSGDGRVDLTFVNLSLSFFLLLIKVKLQTLNQASSIVQRCEVQRDTKEWRRMSDRSRKSREVVMEADTSTVEVCSHRV